MRVWGKIFGPKRLEAGPAPSLVAGIGKDLDRRETEPSPPLPGEDGRRAALGALFAKMADVLDTAERAVEAVNQEAREASESILSSVERVLHEAVAKMQEVEASLLRHPSTESEVSLVARVLAENEKTGTSLRERLASLAAALVRISQQYADLVNRLSTEKLSGLAQDIQTVARRTTLLSLNASIEAARAKEFGRGFSVIAGEIRGLVEHADRAAKGIARLSHEMEAELRRFASALAGEAAGAEAAVAETERFLTNSAARLLEAAEKVTSLAGELRASLSEVEAGVRRVVQAVQFQDITGQKLEAVKGLLDHVRRVLRELAANETLDLPEEKLREYGSQLSAAMGTGVLSLLRPEEVRTGRVGRVYAEFGSNVELF
jgi:methyl-accepting chemotaxis protein